MRVTYFADTPHIGGAERHVADVIAHSVDAGHDVTVLAPQTDLLAFIGETAPKARLVVAGDSAYHSHGGASRGVELAKQLPRLVHAIGRRDPEVLHVNNGGYPGSDLCRLAVLAGAAARVPYRVMTVNSMPWMREHSEPRVQTTVDSTLWASLHHCVCPAMTVAESLIENRGLPREKLRLIRYGVNEPAGAADGPALRQRLAPNGELLVGMVSARAVPEKGYEVFVRALAQTGDDVRGVLVGPHLGDNFLKLVDELGLKERLTIVGPVPSVGAYYHAIELLVVPSTKEEAMPLVILESMAATTAVYGSRLAGVPEAVVEGETGELFTPSDVGGLAELLKAAPSRRDELARMGAAGRRRWEELFAPAALARETQRLYEEGLRSTVSR
jgi:glycosyltransferase involved in cell wall biosynthesis